MLRHYTTTADQSNTTMTSTTPSSASLASHLHLAAAAAADLINSSYHLTQLGHKLTPEHRQTLMTAVDQHVLQQCQRHASAVVSSSNSAAAELLGRAGVALLPGSSSSSSSISLSPDWLKAFSDTLVLLLPSASGESCCHLAAAAAGHRCQISQSGLRLLQQQVRGWGWGCIGHGVDDMLCH